jgi:hypothetical protein
LEALEAVIEAVEQERQHPDLLERNLERKVLAGYSPFALGGRLLIGIAGRVVREWYARGLRLPRLIATPLSRTRRFRRSPALDREGDWRG